MTILPLFSFWPERRPCLLPSCPVLSILSRLILFKLPSMSAEDLCFNLALSPSRRVRLICLCLKVARESIGVLTSALGRLPSGCKISWTSCVARGAWATLDEPSRMCSSLVSSFWIAAFSLGPCSASLCTPCPVIDHNKNDYPSTLIAITTCPFCLRCCFSRYTIHAHCKRIEAHSQWKPQ